jgi:putative sterol carrier protein
MNVDSIRSLLASLKPSLLPPALERATVRCRWELEGGARWDLLLDRGRLSLGEPEGSPDVVIRCDPGQMVRALDGRDNFLTAFARGDLQLQGDLAAAKLLYTFTRYARAAEAVA